VIDWAADRLAQPRIGSVSAVYHLPSDLPVANLRGTAAAP